MVRAGVVQHPAEWAHNGFREIQSPPQRYRRLDLERLAEVMGFSDVHDLQVAHREWLDAALSETGAGRDPMWTEAIAVGQKDFLEEIRSALGHRCPGRRIRENDGTFRLSEPEEPYTPVFSAKRTL
jgi:putative transposase